jgi:hypothetical protein
MSAINTYAAHKSTAQTFTALQTFSSGLNVTSGNVGIGTTSPEDVLHVKGTAQWVQSIIDSSPSTTGGSSVVLRGNQNSWALSSRSSANGTTNNGFSLYESLNDAIRMVVLPGGNVGIGTTSPGHPLDVLASTNSDTARFRGTTTGGYHTAVYIDTTNNAANPYLIFQRNGVSQWQIIGGAQSLSDRFIIGDQQGNDGVYLAQNATSWTANSDARLKDVIGPIENATAKVNALSGVRYTWKRDADKSLAKVRVGLIAQDVFEVLPESVEADTPDLVTDEETGKVSGGLGVRYTELVPLLVNAIKELSQRVEALER